MSSESTGFSLFLNYARTPQTIVRSRESDFSGVGKFAAKRRRAQDDLIDFVESDLVYLSTTRESWR